MRARACRGSETVEAALALPVLILVAFCCLQLALTAYQCAAMSSAISEAAAKADFASALTPGADMDSEIEKALAAASPGLLEGRIDVRQLPRADDPFGMGPRGPQPVARHRRDRGRKGEDGGVAMTRPLAQRGSVSVLSLMLMLMLLLGLAFAADLAGALAMRSSQANLAGIARDSTISGAFLMEAKNADEPGAAVARKAAESLRENGWDGEIEVWFAEAPSSELPASKRAWAWGVRISEESPAWFASVFSAMDGVQVADGACARAVPYTAGQAWRPAGAAVQRKYHFAAGTSTSPDAVSDVALADMPQGVRGQMAAALDEARTAQ